MHFKVWFDTGRNQLIVHTVEQLFLKGHLTLKIQFANTTRLFYICFVDKAYNTYIAYDITARHLISLSKTPYMHFCFIIFQMKQKRIQLSWQHFYKLLCTNTTGDAIRLALFALWNAKCNNKVARLLECLLAQYEWTDIKFGQGQESVLVRMIPPK